MPTLPSLPARVLRALLPFAERDEVLADVSAEYGERLRAEGAWAAGWWVWRQVAASVPPLLRRTFWRGMTGFEPRANSLSPGGPFMESWIIDLRFALRRLRRRPQYAALAISTLALGVGGAAAMATIVRSLVLKPLPYAAEHELGHFWFPGSWSESEHLYIRAEYPGFGKVAAWRHEGVIFQPPQRAARLLPAVSASAELFDVLGRGAHLGRVFQAGDDLVNAAPVAVLSHGLWRELGGDRSIVGRTLRLDGVERTVVGVMPPGFWFPDPTVRLWVSEALDPDNRSGNYTLLGRVAPGVTIGGLGPHLARLTARLGERYDYPPQWDKTVNPEVTPLREALLGPMRPALLATLAAMGMILLIACANVAALMLGQVEGRATELAVRAAVGAERGRLLQQVVAEAALLGLGAGVAGGAVAAAAFRLLVGSLPLGAWAEGASPDWTVFAAAMLTATGASLAIALVPVLSLVRGDLRGTLATLRTSGVGVRGGRLESALVVAEVALAVVMAAGAALLVRSVHNLYAIDPGVRVEGLAVVDVALPSETTGPERHRLLRELRAELARLPGATAAATTEKLPLRGNGNSTLIEVEGRADLGRTTTFFRTVSTGYLEAIGMPLRAGRLFTDADRGLEPPPQGGEMPIVVNEALAARYFPGEDPVGRIVGGIGMRERIVGVVGTAAEGDLTDPPAPARYWLVDHMDVPSQDQTFVVRAAPGLDPEALLEPARRVLQQRVSAMAIQEMTTMDLVLAQAVGPARQVMLLLGLLTTLAVVLGAVGVYGVISHFVLRRRREWAIRLALGLGPTQVVGNVLQRGARLVGGGIAIGVGSAAALARLVDALLYGVGPGDPLALAAAAAVLLLVGVLAALLPAWRASRTPPGLLLRDV
jgi:predicted permease